MTPDNSAGEIPLPGSMAEGIALQRYAETMLPEGIRILSDPLAIRFINPAILQFARDRPAEAKALAEKIEKAMPGWSNAIRLRIRHFDEAAAHAEEEGFTQIVSFGAGYDTRPFRIKTLQQGFRIFEVDRALTLERKQRILSEVFGNLPDQITYLPLDMVDRDPWPALVGAGWSKKEKTLFFLEGLVMYLPLATVRGVFAAIFRNSGKGSSVLFDFVPQFVADGSTEREGSGNIRAWTIKSGEPILSGFPEEGTAEFLSGLGYTNICILPSRELADRYFTGQNSGRTVSGLLSIAHADIPGVGPE